MQPVARVVNFHFQYQLMMRHSHLTVKIVNLRLCSDHPQCPHLQNSSKYSRILKWPNFTNIKPLSHEFSFCVAVHLWHASHDQESRKNGWTDRGVEMLLARDGLMGPVNRVAPPNKYDGLICTGQRCDFSKASLLSLAICSSLSFASSKTNLKMYYSFRAFL